MSTFGLLEYKDASPQVRAIYDDIMATRKTDWINNFWKAIAHDPALLERTWKSIKQIMAPGVLEDFTRQTGIKVVYDTFDANETLETRLLAGKSGYDVVVPTAYFLQRQIKDWVTSHKRA